MKNVLVFAAFIMIASFSRGQSQTELTIDAKKKYETADKELNQVYNNILKEYKADTTFIKSLKRSQKIWIQFRDAEMKMKYPDREAGYYGSVQPMCWFMYKEEVTRERTKTLKLWLDGIEEGDVCNGSVKIKD